MVKLFEVSSYKWRHTQLSVLQGDGSYPNPQVGHHNKQKNNNIYISWVRLCSQGILNPNRSFASTGAVKPCKYKDPFQSAQPETTPKRTPGVMSDVFELVCRSHPG